jgi:hypothetical protein
MNRARLLILTTLGVAWACVATLGQPADARPVDRLARVISALSAARMSEGAMALTGLVVLICSNGGACGR